MATFRFKAGDITSSGKTEILPDKKVISVGQCPFCYKKYTSTKSPGQRRTPEQLESAVRNMIEKHYKRNHED